MRKLCFEICVGTNQRQKAYAETGHLLDNLVRMDGGTVGGIAGKKTRVTELQRTENFGQPRLPNPWRDAIHCIVKNGIFIEFSFRKTEIL